jgi:peroxiredoxin
MTTDEHRPQKRTRPAGRWVVPLLLGLGLFLIGAAIVLGLSERSDQALSGSGIPIPPTTVNFSAPTFQLTDLHGKPSSLAAYRGHVVLVNNWATWCPPCQAEIPSLEAYYQAHRSQGLVMVGIEAGEPAAQVAAFVSRNAMSYPVWLDPQGLALNAFDNFNLPSTYIVDPQGTVLLSWTGELNLPTLEQYVTPLLKEK